MTNITTIVRKELRTWFQSPVALIFLGVFLALTLVGFFSYSRFFARNIADVRPLFQMLPVLLIFLVSAITMRQWADERRTGTLEVLLTLPLRTRDLVLGKFFSGLFLVALALLLTLPLPITVSMLGDLDWGPVVGGYVGALLLASAYLAIGLCVSARTDNQVVALMVTLVLGGLLYVLGTDWVTGLMGNTAAEVFHDLGTGSRFESIERGVLDLRDLTYYVGLTLFFLVLNGAFLELDRVDADSSGGRRKRFLVSSVVGLVGLNVLAANIWLAPLATLRLDITQNQEYSVSDVTRDTLAALDEPLTIMGLFSERTHPLLQPLVPQIRDLLAEYQVYGGDKVDVQFLDPNADEELEAEISQQYGIRSVPFRVSDRHQESVVNSYFHILVKYGDKYETLSFDQLIEVDVTDEDIDVRLKNLEYDLTRTIRRVSQQFQSIEAILAKLNAPAQLTFYVTPAVLPEDLAELAELTRTVCKDMESSSKGMLTFQEQDPSQDANLPEQLYQQYHLQPYALDLFGQQTFYLHLVLQVGDKAEKSPHNRPGDDVEAEELQCLEGERHRGKADHSPGGADLLEPADRRDDVAEVVHRSDREEHRAPDGGAGRQLSPVHRDLLSGSFRIRRTWVCPTGLFDLVQPERNPPALFNRPTCAASAGGGTGGGAIFLFSASRQSPVDPVPEPDCGRCSAAAWRRRRPPPQAWRYPARGGRGSPPAAI